MWSLSKIDFQLAVKFGTVIEKSVEEQGKALALTCCAAGTSPSDQPRSSAPGIGSLRSKLRLLKRGKCLKLKVTFSRIVPRMLKILQVSKRILTKAISEKTVMKHLFVSIPLHSRSQ